MLFRNGNRVSSGQAAGLQRWTRGGSFIVCKEQNIAGLAFQSAADFLECFKVNSNCLAFF